MWPSRVKRVLKDRWLGLCVGMWMQACGGISYAFSLYSGDLKHTLGYNQEMIDGLGSAKDIGGNVGIISGLLIDLTSAWFVLLVGGLLHFCFYFLVSSKTLVNLTRFTTWELLNRLHFGRAPAIQRISFAWLGTSQLLKLNQPVSPMIWTSHSLFLQLFLSATGRITPSYWQVCSHV